MADTQTTCQANHASERTACPAEDFHMDEETAMNRIRALFVGIQAMGHADDPVGDIIDLAAIDEAIANDRLRAIRTEG
jgi:hypothetical protein